MTPETRLRNAVLIATSPLGVRLFRNNVARGWVGRVVARSPERLVLTDYRPLHAGLCTGSSDLIGWTPVDGVAVFTALEFKTGRGRLTEDQARFIARVSEVGGIAAEVRSVEEALAAVRPR